MQPIHPVILCGGSGTRLWPKSSKAMPKPFLPLVGKETLFEATLSRAADPLLFTAPMIVTGTAHLAHVEAQLGKASGGHIIIEPEAKNTAAAIALAAARLPKDGVMLVCPSDHHIADVSAFHEAIAKAAKLAMDDKMVAFGITPTSPETGYGYIKRGKEIAGGFVVDRFVEKPDFERAMQFLTDGSFSWNGGIFAFRAGAFMDELTAHRPALAEAVIASVAQGKEDGTRFHPEAAAFAQIKSESVDYAVMEETQNAAMVPVAMGWSDIGNWQSLHDAREGDEFGNSTRGPVEVVDCKNTLIESDGPRVSVIGLENIAVVVDGDEVLVTTMAGAQKVGQLKGAANQ